MEVQLLTTSSGSATRNSESAARLLKAQQKGPPGPGYHGEFGYSRLEI